MATASDLDLARRANAIVAAVQELPRDAQPGAARGHCAGDPALLALVGRLLGMLHETHAALPTGGALAQLNACPVDAQAIGTRVGGYTLRREIGRGGMGVVYLAQPDAVGAAPVALKLLERSEDPDAAERVRREACALTHLRHPGIAALLDAGVHAGRPWLVMEHVDGERIDHYCRARQLASWQIARLVAAVARTLAHAHTQLGECRLVHRDIKPANVHVDAQGRVKLLDFGIASCNGATGATTERSSPHTPAYASPEQRAGAPITMASDIYQLGLLLEILLASSDGGADATLARIVQRATAEDPSQRHASAAQFADALEAYACATDPGQPPSTEHP